MTSEEAATQGFVDREIDRLRDELRALKELWTQKSIADEQALKLRTAQVEKELLDLNHAHKLAREVAATVVDNVRYEEQMTALRVQLQEAKDVARVALGVSAADLSRQLASALGQVGVNKQEIDDRFNTLSAEVKADVAHRAGVAEAVSADAKTAADRARGLSLTSVIISALAVVTAIATLAWNFFKGATP